MDEIFRLGSSRTWVFVDKDLCRRRRPEKFIAAEVQRTETANASVVQGKGEEAVHVEVERAPS